MGLIQLGGLGSGLDVNSIIDALVNAERAPKTFALDNQEAELSVTLSGLGGLKSALSEIRASAFSLSLASTFEKKTASLSSQDNISVVGNTSSLPGSYDVEVVSLAQGSEFSSSIFTGGGSTTFGDGSLIFTANGNSFEVDVSATDTLEEIQANINSAGGNFGVSVTVLSDITDGIDTGSVFKVNSSVAGAGNDLVITTGVGSDASLDDLSVNLTQDEFASDAEIKVDGFTSINNTNSFENIIEGVTITAEVINTAGETTTLTVKEDTDSVKTLITSLVDNISNFLDTAAVLGSADKDAPGLLLGDASLRQAESQIRNALTAVVADIESGNNSLTALGITTTSTGSLNLSSSRLSTAVDDSFDTFSELFTNDDGIATRLLDIVDSFAGSDGVIQARESSINGIFERITDERIALDLRVEKLQSRLVQQFSAMDRIVSQFNATASFITQQFANLPGFNSGDDS